MSKAKTIPIDDAMRISLDTGFQEIVVFGYDPKTGRQGVTTYGRTVPQSRDAARAGNHLKKALGWPEEICHTVPDLSRHQHEVDRVAWAILQALHKDVPEEQRPMSWSDLAEGQEERIRAAAVAAITVDLATPDLPQLPDFDPCDPESGMADRR